MISPQETITKAEFLTKFNFKGDALDTAYSQAAQDGKDKAKGWLSPDGDRWSMAGGRNNRMWSMGATEPTANVE